MSLFKVFGERSTFRYGVPSISANLRKECTKQGFQMPFIKGIYKKFMTNSFFSVK